MLHNLRQALKREWSGIPLWRRWFEVESAAETRDLDYVSSAAAAVMEQSPRGGQQLLWAIVAFVAVMLIWAGLAEVDEFTRGEGKVIPSRNVQVVQNLEGGILVELHVREGDRVEEGQPLLRIDDTGLSSPLREASITVMQLRARVGRLAAEADGRAFQPEKLEGVPAELLQQQLEVHQSRRRELDSRAQVLVSQSLQRKQELAELEAKRNQVGRSLKLLQSELQLTRPLAAQGAISQVELLRLERQVNDLQGELEAAELGVPRLESALQEAQQKLANVELAFQTEAEEEKSEATAELARLEETTDALADRVRRTLVRSPVDGTIKRLMVKTLGGIIQPGMDIVEVVPTEDKLLVEAKIRPADIGFLHPGQKAKVKFTAYDFSIHGSLDGEVILISPDTIVDENEESFYLVRVETEAVFFGSEQQPLPIIPGMMTSVDILTGQKTVLDYLLKPILKTRELALRER